MNSSTVFLLLMPMEDKMGLKSEGFHIVAISLQFKALVANQNGNKIKTLRTDNEEEFVYSPFIEHWWEERTTLLWKW